MSGISGSLTPQEQAFLKAHRILKELREMGEPLASFTLYVDGSGVLAFPKKLPSGTRRFVEFYLKSTRWGVDGEGRITLTTSRGLLEE